MNTNADPGTLRTLARATGYFELGMLEESSAELDAMDTRVQSCPEVFNMRCMILLARKAWKAVITLGKLASAIYPSRGEFFIHTAIAYDKAGRPDLAKEIWKAAPDVIRNSGFYHYNVARCEAKLGNVQSAHRHIARAITLEPRFADVLKRDPRIRRVVALECSRWN